MAAAGSLSAAGLLTLRRVMRAEQRSTLPLEIGAAPFDLILVLGAHVSGHGPSGELRARLDHALKLWRSGLAPVIGVSGGVADGIDEVEAMREYLTEREAPEAVIVAIRPGDSTRVTLSAVKARGAIRTVAVSSPYHAYRLEREAKRQAVQLVVNCPPSTPDTRETAMRRAKLLTETVAVFWYSIPTAVSSRVPTGPGSPRHVLPFLLAGRRRRPMERRPGSATK